MGRKTQYCSQIQQKMGVFMQLGQEASNLIGKFKGDYSTFAIPREGGQGHYIQAKDKFGTMYGDKLGQHLDQMDMALNEARTAARDLEALLTRQKSNLFKRFSKHYQEAEKFLRDTKPQLDTLDQVLDEIKRVLQSDAVPYACYLYFEQRAWA